MSAPSIPSRMTAIGIAEPGGPRRPRARRARRARTRPRRGAGRGRGGGREPSRRDAAPGPLSAASRGVGHSRPGDRGHRGRARRRSRRPGRRIPGVRARHRRRIRRVLHRAGAALPPRARRTRRGAGRGPPRDLLHRMGQRLRPRPPRRGGIDPRARRVERHRHHRDTAREGVRCNRSRHRRFEGEMRRLPGDWGPTRPSTTATRTSSSASARSPAGTGSTWCSTWSPATTSRGT